MPDRPPQLFLTARMAHTAGMAVTQGIPGSGELLEHAMESLLGLHVDTDHGGWISQPGSVGRKSAYDHVHVGLAAATAMSVGHEQGAELFDQVSDVIDRHLWDAHTATLQESFAADWSNSEEYRGANANMHGVEAMLAMGRASQNATWHQRALAIAERIVNGAARHHNWLVPEHYSPAWDILADYNKDQPMHPFRPFGATPGHSLEWARFLVELDGSTLIDSPSWLVPAAEELAGRALDEGWGIDGRPGLVYTVDWSGNPVADVRLHWPVCEGIQAAAALYRRTAESRWETWYRRLWDHAARYFIDDRGTWRNELAEDMSEGAELWPGRPDVYHCGGALCGPLSGA